MSGGGGLPADGHPPPDASAGGRAQEIVDRAIDAHGGMDAWHRIRDVHNREERIRERETGRSVSTRDSYLKRYHGDMMVRIEVTGGTLERLGPDGFPSGEPVTEPIVLGYDGREFWETRSGRLVTDPDAIASARFVVMAWRCWFCIPFVLNDPGVRLTYQGEDLIDDRPVHLVEVTFDSGTGDNPDDRFLYFINRETFLVENLRYWMRGRDRHREFRLRDYVPMGDVIHDTVHLYHNAQGVYDGKKITEIVSVNSGLGDELFRPPSHSRERAPAGRMSGRTRPAALGVSTSEEGR